MSIVLVDSGGSNISSVCYALKRLGVDAHLTAKAEELHRADKVILPGVGAAGPAMARLRELNLVETVRGLTQPVLGVCLGMQLLCAHSAEGDVDCLGVIPAQVERFQERPGRRVPHMGWNRIKVKTSHALLAGLENAAWAYFVHSYAVPSGPWSLAECDYEGVFAAVIMAGNFYGVQFHPERSAATGARLLKNFLEL